MGNFSHDNRGKKFSDAWKKKKMLLSFPLPLVFLPYLLIPSLRKGCIEEMICKCRLTQLRKLNSWCLARHSCVLSLHHFKIRAFHCHRSSEQHEHWWICFSGGSFPVPGRLLRKQDLTFEPGLKEFVIRQFCKGKWNVHPWPLAGYCAVCLKPC